MYSSAGCSLIYIYIGYPPLSTYISKLLCANIRYFKGERRYFYNFIIGLHF